MDMDLQEIKKKILDGQITEEEINTLIKKLATPTRRKSGGFFKTILSGFIEGYTKPMILKVILEASLIFAIIAGVITLSILGKIDPTITMVLLAFVLGYVLGKIK